MEEGGHLVLLAQGIEGYRSACEELALYNDILNKLSRIGVHPYSFPTSRGTQHRRVKCRDGYTLAVGTRAPTIRKGTNKKDV